jgi:hypothetical protein
VGNRKRNRRGDQGRPAFLLLVDGLSGVEQRKCSSQKRDSDERPALSCPQDDEGRCGQDDDRDGRRRGRFRLDAEQRFGAGFERRGTGGGR